MLMPVREARRREEEKRRKREGEGGEKQAGRGIAALVKEGKGLSGT